MALLDTIGVRNNAADELRAALKQQVRARAAGVGRGCSCGKIDAGVQLCAACEPRAALLVTDASPACPRCSHGCSLRPRPLSPLQERTQARELAAVEAEAAARVRELLAHTRDNTDALNAVSGLTRSQRGLEAEVLSHKSGLFEDQLAARRAALGERHALVTVVNERAAALTALRSKLATLRRKDSVLYA